MKNCRDCGAPLPAGSGEKRRFCDACITRHKQESGERKREARRLAREREAAKRNMKTLSQVAREAAEHGVSYGVYVSRI